MVRPALAALIFGLLVAAGAGSAVTAPKVGERAPDFRLRGSDGSEVTLSQFVGKRGVVLAWFPKAFTPG